MKSRFAFAAAGLLGLFSSFAFSAQGPGPAWPKNEYGQVVFEGGRAVVSTGEAARKQVEKRLLNWFTKNFYDGQAVNGGKLSARGEFNGWGSFRPVTVGQHDYKFRVGVGARLLTDSLSYRIGEIQCTLEDKGKRQTLPLEKLLKSPNPEYKQAATAFRQQLDEFIKAL